MLASEKNMDKRLLDKNWRIEHLYKIVDKKTLSAVQFKRNRMQKHFDEHKAKRNIILKSRQLGATTHETIDMLDDSMFTRNFNGLFIAHTKDAALSIFDKKIKFAWENVVEGLRKLYTLAKDSSNELKIGFGDGSFSSVIVANSGRSGTFNRVHISEFAKLCKLYPERAEEVVTGTFKAVPTDGRIDIESTAEGETGHFADMFWEAWNRGEPEFNEQFKAHFYNWQWDDDEIGKVTDEEIEKFIKSEHFKTFDDYRSKMRERKIEITDKELTFYYKQWLSYGKDWSRLRQECPTTAEEAFIGSGNKLFDQDRVAELQPKDGKKEGDWIIYEDYTHRGIYVMGADVAEGVGQDSSTAVVLNISSVPYSVVATFKNNNIAPDQFAFELDKFGKRYGTCLIAPEINNMGHATVLKLKEIYPNVYREEDKRKQLETKSKFTRPIKTLRYGWRTTGSSKPTMMYDLNEAINNGEIEVNDKTTIHELRTYDREDLTQVRFDEKQTKHWDMVLALSIAYQLRTKVVRNRTKTYKIPN